MSDHDTWNMFAAAAMQGMLASPHLADHIKNVGSPPTTMDTYDYVAIAARAYADALLAESKKRETPAEPTPPQPDDDGWIEHDGAGMPVPGETLVKIRCRDGYIVSTSSAALQFLASDGRPERDPGYVGNWWLDRSSPHDIVAYRIVSEAGVTK